ncbi:MAG: hypothetical protein AAF985_16215 [Bacteroidota bacterium]
MQRTRVNLLWALLFGAIFLLSQSHHLISFSHQPSLLGLPFWLWCYMGIHVLLVAALFVYSRKTEHN